MRESFALVADENHLWAVEDEPSIEDFEAAEEEEQQVGRSAVRFRILRVVGVLFVVLALVFYLVVPANSLFRRLAPRLRLPTIRSRPIPNAPEHKGNPKFPT